MREKIDPRDACLYIDVACYRCERKLAITNTIQKDGRYYCWFCVGKNAERITGMNEVIDGFGKHVFGLSRFEALNQHICIDCRKQVTQFRNMLSRKEYFISGLCQECQDNIFG